MVISSNVRCQPGDMIIGAITLDTVGNWDSVWRQYHVFSFWKIPPPTNFPLASECFLMFSPIVFLRSWCIASLKVLKYNLEGHLKKVYDCFRFIQVLTQPQSLRIRNLVPRVLWIFGQRVGPWRSQKTLDTKWIIESAESFSLYVCTR